MAISLGLRLVLDGTEVDPRLLDLLKGIDRHGSLQHATREVGLSYRRSWDLLGRFEHAVGRRAVQLERGRGASLTPFGRKLAEGVLDIETRLASELEHRAGELDRAFVALHAPAPAR